MSLCARVTSDGEHGGGEVRLERCEQRRESCMRESWIRAERRRRGQERGGSRMGDGGARPPHPGGGGRRRDSLPSQYPPRSFPLHSGPRVADPSPSNWAVLLSSGWALPSGSPGRDQRVGKGSREDVSFMTLPIPGCRLALPAGSFLLLSLGSPG